jgi:hypothetical protein
MKKPIKIQKKAKISSIPPMIRIPPGVLSFNGTSGITHVRCRDMDSMLCIKQAPNANTDTMISRLIPAAESANKERTADIPERVNANALLILKTLNSKFI